MKKKITYILMGIMLGSMLVACGADDSNTEEMGNTESSVETTEDKTTEGNEVAGLPGFSVGEAVESSIDIANMSGIDFTSLTLSFSEGSIQGQNIVGEKSFKDGSMISYAISDITMLKNAKNLTLSVVGATKKGEEIDFGTISVIDPTGMVLVLKQEKKEFSMYIN